VSLKDIPLKGVYRTATDSLVRDFYIPFLGQSLQYDRAVGYFSSSMLIEAAFGLSGLIRNGGRMRLVIGHPLSEEDFASVQHGQTLQRIQDQLLRDLLHVLESAGSERNVHSLELLSWLVATESLEIRYAFKKTGMYHEKIGIMTDSEGNKLVFHGSANESASALLPTRNFESLAVYPSWNESIFDSYGKPFVDGFESLWRGDTKYVISVPVPSAVYEELAKYRIDRHMPPDLEIEADLLAPAQADNDASKIPVLPISLGGERYMLRPHQVEALRHWKANSYAGIFALATGSGKTVTALHAASRFAQQGSTIALIVSVPYQVLAEQWCDVMRLYGMRPIKAFYTREKWELELREQVSSFVAGSIRFMSVVVVNETLSSDTFQAVLSDIPTDRLMFVGDECHHHAGETWLTKVPLKARFRLGMSATPWNPGQLQKRGILEHLYGPVVASYSLRNALADKVLCPYRYHVVSCGFDDDEAAEYERLSKLISSLRAQDPDGANPAIRVHIQIYASRRARLLGAIRDKRVRLDAVLSESPVSPHTLVYCGEGRHPLEDEGSEEDRIISLAVRSLASTGCKVGRITAVESVSERKRILAAFDDGLIDAIAAIRVLDEGFDIPSCRTAFLLASSTSFRQYVQRRGRVLRRAPGKEEATIYDFMALPSLLLLEREKEIWTRQVATELARLREFIELASNRADQQLAISSTLKALKLGAMYYEEAPVSEEELYGD
jgi:superfamily II DNA or RNA helicase